MKTVGDVMSHGVLTVQDTQTVSEIVGRLRRIGHEGYPVVDDNGEVVGLLTARDLNRADANGLTSLQVADVMLRGDMSRAPETPLDELPRLMLDSGWGQIPVVRHNALVGIVTRTDLLRYFAEVYATEDTALTVSAKQIRQVLGGPVAEIITRIGQHAVKSDVAIYLVGGLVRDLLLGRQNDDIDFVLEGDAVAFAEGLVASHGGIVETHSAFGTAKWVLDETVAAWVGYNLDALPKYIDLVTARYEFYEQPAALPTVYRGGIRLDLRRRDFTINALAVRLEGGEGEVIDLFGGVADIDAKLIRALHSLSFADDPTRTLRAVRFALRLGFEIEPDTRSLIHTALPMMGKITGERLYNELTLLLQEDHPARGVMWLQDMGVLKAIHPDFRVGDEVEALFSRAGDGDTPWLILAGAMEPDSVGRVAERLLIPKKQAAAMVAFSKLMHETESLVTETASESTRKLDRMPVNAVTVGATIHPDEKVRASLKQYLDEWRHVQPKTDGNTLKALGLKPGPHFRDLLNRLRDARIDGEILSDEEEATYLDRLVRELGDK